MDFINISNSLFLDKNDIAHVAQQGNDEINNASSQNELSCEKNVSPKVASIVEGTGEVEPRQTVLLVNNNNLLEKPREISATGVTDSSRSQKSCESSKFVELEGQTNKLPSLSIGSPFKDLQDTVPRDTLSEVVEENSLILKPQIASPKTFKLNNLNFIEKYKPNFVKKSLKINEPHRSNDYNNDIKAALRTNKRSNVKELFKKIIPKFIYVKLKFKRSKIIVESYNNPKLDFLYSVLGYLLGILTIIVTFSFIFAQKQITRSIDIIVKGTRTLIEITYPTMEFYMQRLGERFKTMDKGELQGKVFNLVDETVDNFGGRKLAEEAQKNLKKRKKLYYRLKRQLFLYLNRPLAQSEAEVIEDARIYCRDYIHDRLKRSGIVISLKHLPVGPSNEISRQIQSMGLYLEAMYPTLFCNIDAQLSGGNQQGGTTVVRNTFLTIDRVTYLLSRLAHNLFRPDPVSNAGSFDLGGKSREASTVSKNAQIYNSTSSVKGSDKGEGIRRRLNSQTTTNTESQKKLSHKQVSGKTDGKELSVGNDEVSGVGDDVLILPETTITWGTIVALFALAGAFSVSSVLQGRLEFLPIITEKVTSIVKEELSPWIAAQPGGWVALITQYKIKEETSYRKWHIVVGTIIALAFTVLALETIPNFDEFQHKLVNHTYLFFD